MLTDAQSKFIDDLEGDISPEQAARLLEIGEIEETAPVNDETDTPVDTKEDENQEQQEEKPTAIVMPDGKHTIDYSVLEQERAEKLALQAQLQALQEQQQAATQNTTDVQPLNQESQNEQIANAAIAQGIPEELFGDFSEEALAKGVNYLVEQRVQAILDAQLAPIKQTQAQTEYEKAYDEHMQSILSVHDDAQSIVQSDQFVDWVKAQPSYAQSAIVQTVQQGTAEQIIEVLNNYKGNPQASDDTQSIKEQASNIIANTKPSAPNSLSDIAGGHSDNHIDNLQDLNSIDLMDKMDGWTQDQITEYLNKL